MVVLVAQAALAGHQLAEHDVPCSVPPPPGGIPALHLLRLGPAGGLDIGRERSHVAIVLVVGGIAAAASIRAAAAAPLACVVPTSKTTIIIIINVTGAAASPRARGRLVRFCSPAVTAAAVGGTACAVTVALLALPAAVGPIVPDVGVVCPVGGRRWRFCSTGAAVGRLDGLEGLADASTGHYRKLQGRDGKIGERVQTQVLIRNIRTTYAEKPTESGWCGGVRCT